ncbi:MAG: TIGR02757 family protein [Vicinamibacterales bacterium]
MRRIAGTPRTRSSVASLKTSLDRLYESFNMPDSAVDPIQLVRRYRDRADVEVVAFCAAGLAFGRVSSVMQSVERLLHVMGDRPAAFVRAFEPTRDGAPLTGFVHRWIRGRDVVALLWVLRQAIEQHGSLEDFFLAGDDGHEDLRNSLDSFSTRALSFDLRPAYGKVPARPGVSYFFPRPSAGSACKRLNLFMRWVVRRDALDFGIWTRVSPARLIVPLDTHVIRVGRCLKLTQYTSPGWTMAADITRALRGLDSADPVRYDFSICHLGMMNACGFETPRGDAHCPLKGSCHVRDGLAVARRPR